VTIDAELSMSENQPKHVIVAGYGPVGRFVVDALEARGVSITLVELNLNTIERQRKQGRSVVHGDIADLTALERAGLSRASALILTVPDDEAAMRACHVARLARPDLFIAMRMKHASQAMLARQAGADHVTIEEIVTAHAMQQAVANQICPVDDPVVD